MTENKTIRRRENIIFTQAHDDIIIYELKNCPTNMCHAIKRAALKTGHTTVAIKNRWYLKLRHVESVNAITCGSEKGFTKNVKNVHVSKKTGEMPDQGLQHYLYIVKEILNLPQIERNAIIALLCIE